VKTIRALRQARQWTQFELALKAGVQPQTVYLWESGRRMPQVPQLRRLGQLFEICSDEIELVSARADASAQGSPRADRHPGESAPGRDEPGHPVIRGPEAPDASFR
jgi:transcriptional regulator with XRE-family HTH domain